MLQTATRRLFPLHLAPIDDFFLLDDRATYPMTFASNLFFTGEFEPSAFQSALECACQRHPLFSALIGRAKQGKVCWIDAGDVVPQVDWGRYDDPIRFHQGEYIDLEREVGLRAWVRQSDGRARLVLQFHHACSDGTGAHRFIGDVLAGYGARTSDGAEAPRAAAYNVQMLKTRRHKLASLDTLKSAGRLTGTAFHQLYHVYGKRIAPLAVPRGLAIGDNQEDGFPGVVSHTFHREQHQQLRDLATRHGVMLNDFLLAEMFRAMAIWNQTHDGSRGKRFRIMMPSDLRDVPDFSMPAANMTSYNFITRHRKACLDSLKLARSIREETAAIKNENRGRYFVESLMASSYVPGLLRYLTSARRCVATITVSNMGDPTRRFLATFPRRGGKLVCGNLTLQKMLGVSPMRPMTRASVSIVTFYRDLILNVRCDPNCMRVADARAFLATYVDCLNEHLKGDVSVPTCQLAGTA